MRLWIAACLLCVSATAAAADTIRIVIPYAPGGALDPLARILANGLGKVRPGDAIVVENIGGAGGIVGMSTVAKAPPDGRTFLFSPSGNIVISPWLQATPYDVTRAFEPIALVGSVKSAMIVRASLGVATLAELIALSKAGAKLTYGSPGIGTSPHISGAILNHAAGIAITHVPYRGLGPALNDIVGGHIDFLNGDITVLYPQVTSGALRALAVAGTERSALLPDVPTAQELGYKDVYMENWYGALVPAATPPDVVAKLEAAMMDAVKTPEVWAKISANGVYAPQDAKTFRAQIEKDIVYWGAEIKKLGITAE